jgi:hypothetical protein
MRLCLPIAFLIPHYLPFVNQRSLIVAEGDLISHAARVIVQHGLNHGFHDLAARHGDADAVADRVLPWRWVGIFRHGAIVCYFRPEAKMVSPGPIGAEKYVCGVIKADGKPCQSRVKPGSGPCMWHANTLGQKFDAWLRNQPKQAALAILFGLVTLFGVGYDLLKPSTDGFLQLHQGFNSRKFSTDGIELNIAFKNDGGKPVDGAFSYSELSMVQISSDSDKSDKEVRERFRAILDKKKMEIISQHASGLYVGKGNSMWDTAHMPLTQDQIDEILQGRLRLYLNAWAQWRGAAHDLEQCLWLQTPLTNDLTNSKLIWHVCAQ